MTSAPPSETASMLKILVAEDDDPVRLSLTSYLRDRSYPVTEVNNGHAALRSLDTELVDVIISDIRMPILDGIGLLRAVKEKHPQIEVILVTGFQDLDTAIYATRHNAYDYITKPFNLKEIVRVLQRIQSEKEMQARLRAKQEELVKARRLAALGLLAAGIMHEINNPNTFILGNAEYLKRTLDKFFCQADHATAFAKATGISPAEIEKVINGIVRGSERIEAIVNRSTKFRLRNGHEIHPHDLRAAVEAAVRVASENLPTGVKILMSLPPEATMVFADEEELLQMASNLLTNAVEAVKGRDHGEIGVTLYREPSLTVFEVSDTGSGLDPKIAEFLFQPFASAKLDRPGRGLGLFIVHQILQNLGGRIRHERRGGLTVFRIELPAQNESVPGKEV